MKTHTQDFKNKIKEMGRELDSIITYTIDNEEIELGNEELNSITPHYEGNILKSVMKQLDIDSNVNIPLGTEINYQLGLKIGDNEVIDYRDNYEYLGYGNYIVYSSEKQEDTNSYKIIAYDKMLFSMVDYEALNITYPITIRNYISAICNHLGLVFKNSSDTFVNYDKEIANELYLDSNGNSLGYTFRDVLDELAQVTASTICLDDNDELEIRYITLAGDTTQVEGTSIHIDDAVKQGILYEGINNITQTNNDLPFELELEYISFNDTEVIDEEYLKDINVNFGEKYGAINTISFKRSGDSDVISKSIPEELPDDEKIEIAISDNQILNGNNRDEYIDGILNKLYGLEYYINDFSSTGICYLDLCDRYYVKIDNKYYSCIMFNDEVNITQGLEENIHTDLPKESETDYTKTDKTDRRLNQTYLIVDKQNQRIDSVISTVDDESERITQLSQDVDGISSSVTQQIGEQNQKISLITQNVDEINQKIQDIADITTSGESSYGRVDLINVNESEPISVKIRPISSDITRIYPSSSLYPSSNTYPKEVILRFTNTTTQEVFDYIIPNDLLYYNQDTYDEFSLAYGDGTNRSCTITKRVEHTSQNGVNQVIQETIISYPYPNIHLTSGDYTIELVGYNNVYLYVQLMASNIYTTQFATRVELSSSINQTKDEINLEVSKKIDDDKVIASINLTSEQATISANKINIQGTLQAINNDTSTTINGNKITTGSITSSQVASDIITTSNLSAQTISANNISGGTINGNNVNITNLNASQIKAGTLTAAAINLGSGNFAVNTSGTLTANSGTIGGWSIASGRLRGLTGQSGVYGAIRPYGVQLENSSGTVIMSAGWGDVINASISDKRAKNSINNIEEKYERFFNELKPVTFYFNKEFSDNKKHIGFIAQDILESQKEIDEDLAMVKKDSLSKKYNLNKQEIIALNTWQVQLLKKQVKAQQEIIDNLTQRIEKLERKIDK